MTSNTHKQHDVNNTNEDAACIEHNADSNANTALC